MHHTHRVRGAEGAVTEWRSRAARRLGLGLALALLAGCGGPAPRHRSAGTAGTGDFMGVTQTRCAQGDAGACRMLRAMDR